jgi:formate-dependent nitrite reductase membrane component NrfD
MLFLAEHFATPPEWTWYILFYFFFAGLSGGSYALATLLRLSGDPRDAVASRLGHYIALLTLIPCPILLTADLGASWYRFWHMLINVTPGDTAPIFHYWSPMSLGAWALLIFGPFALFSAAEAWLTERRGAPFPAPLFGRVIAIIGSLLALFIASYTGVLLSVSNQPVWSDTWALGGLFLASGLSGAAALITLLIRYRPQAAITLPRIRIADGYFSILELVLLAAFFITVALAGQSGRILPWFPLWIVAVVGIFASLLGLRRPTRVMASGDTAVAPVAMEATAVSALVLVAILALRAAVIFSAQ